MEDIYRIGACGMIIAILLKRSCSSQRKRRVWMREWIKNRSQFVAYHLLVQKWRLTDGGTYRYFLAAGISSVLAISTRALLHILYHISHITVLFFLHGVKERSIFIKLDRFDCFSVVHIIIGHFPMNACDCTYTHVHVTAESSIIDRKYHSSA